MPDDDHTVGHVGAALGAPADDPRRASVTLRALASRHGVELTDVSSTDADAAVAAIELWAASMGLSPSVESHLAPPGARAALSRIVARAAGRPAPGLPTSGDPGRVPDGALPAIDAVLDWLDAHPERDEVLNKVYCDLRGDPVLEAVARALHPGVG